MQRTFAHAFLSKATLIALFTVGAVTLPATAVYAQSAKSTDTAQSAGPTLALSASASETVAQDTVTLTLNKEVRGENQVELSRSVNEAMNKVRDKAKADKDLEVRTGSYQVWFERDNNRPVQPAAAGTGKADAKDNSKEEDTGGIWVARGELLITSKDMEKTSQFAADV